VFKIQEKIQKSEMEFEKMKTELIPNLKKIELEYDAMRQDLKTLNQKIEEGLQRCFEDSEKLDQLSSKPFKKLKGKLKGTFRQSLTF